MELKNEHSECSFILGKDTASGEVCADEFMIKKMAEVLKGMGTHHTAATVKNNPEIVVRDLKTKLNCDSEECLLKRQELIQVAGNEAIEKNKENIKQDGPARPGKWLSNSDIDSILEQYAKVDPTFQHIKYQMLDFLEQPNTLKDVSMVQKYKSGMKSFGVSFNTDISTGGGKHWYCLFGDFRTKPATLEYFNSSGSPPQTPVSIWLEDTKNRMSAQLGLDVRVIYHSTVHQTDDHNCGNYALYYILSRYTGVPYSVFQTRRFGEAHLNKFRKCLFQNRDL
jgi:hypothetical protein